MSTRTHRTSLAAAAAVLAFAALAPAAGASQLRGANITPDWITQSESAVSDELSAAERLGADAIRIPVPWLLVEPRRGHVDRGFVAKLDRTLRRANRRGLEVLVLTGATPCWAADDATPAGERCSAAQEQRFAFHPPRHMDDYRRHVSWLTRHYGHRLLRAIEVNNETDTADFWSVGPGQDPAVRYAQQVKAAWHGVKTADPKVKVIAGALAGSDLAWLKRLYAAGIKGHYDALSLHPYDISFDAKDAGFGSPTVARAGDTRYDFEQGVAAAHALQVRHGDTKPLWLTEFGYATCPGGPCVDEDTQARWLSDSFTQAARLSYVQAAISYCIRDYNQKWATFGLQRIDGSDKPAFSAVAATLKTLRTTAVEVG